MEHITLYHRLSAITIDKCESEMVYRHSSMTQTKMAPLYIARKKKSANYLKLVERIFQFRKLSPLAAKFSTIEARRIIDK